MRRYTPIEHHHTSNGRVHLSRQVLRLDDHHHFHRRHRAPGDLLFDLGLFVCRFGPLAVLVALCVGSWIGFLWLLLAIGRAVRSITGGL